MEDFELEIKRDFLNEAKELVENTEQSFLELENDPQNKTLIDAIFRFAHNLKGTSRAVGFGQIAELTHVAENLLLEIKNGKLTVTANVVSTLLVFNDKVREMIEGLCENIEAQFEFQGLLQSLNDVIEGKSTSEIPSKDDFESEEESKQESIESVDHITEASSDFEIDPELLAEAMGLAGNVPNNVINMTEVVQPPKKEVKKEQRKDDETIRVSINRLEKLNDMVGELVILQSLVESSLQRSGDTKIARSLGKLCHHIQDLSMSLRMVPVGPSFQKLNRIVRDTSKLLNKKVELILLGEETEIDKTVAESLGDPLVHIIRNAIDHGVEIPEDRLKAGKSEVGAVEVMAFHEGNFLVIQITDDGKGIDGNILIEKAKKKGIIPQQAQLSLQQGVELIFHPGFSTKDQVSEVSGRGVGMDVVKTNIEALGGEVRVRSAVGQGSCFRLMLPLTLAIIDGMLIKSNKQTYVVPKTQVQEVVRLEKKNISKHTGRIPYYTLRNEVMPLFHLGADLGSTEASREEIALVVKHSGLSFAIIIDDILKQQQIVVKPATKEIHGRAGVMGTTILGDGRPSLIIDLLDMYLKRIKKETINQAQAA